VPNPLVSTARKMVEAALEFKADFILAVGGGSVLDTCKGVAHAVADPAHDIWDFWTGTKVEKSLPIGAILTISAAGSETSNSAVLTNDTKVPPTKRGINNDFNRCKFFEPNAEAIRGRQMELHQVIRNCRVELGYLDRLETYMEHKRRRGAVYEKVHTHYMPLYRGEDEGKTDSAGGFEKGEKQ